MRRCVGCGYRCSLFDGYGRGVACGCSMLPPPERVVELRRCALCRRGCIVIDERGRGVACGCAALPPGADPASPRSS